MGKAGYALWGLLVIFGFTQFLELGTTEDIMRFEGMFGPRASRESVLNQVAQMEHECVVARAGEQEITGIVQNMSSGWEGEDGIVSFAQARSRHFCELSRYARELAEQHNVVESDSAFALATK